ncbi:biotin/lipoyl-binding protein [Candidatus Gracilibacteria bacterium]|nr:biotin/lipoyl-binding protein [Candidatus Gracilibacteria bacterium]
MLILCLLLGGLFLIKNINFTEREEEEALAIIAKKVERINFGDWVPQKNREILATVESEQEVAILAQLSGTIEQVMVQIGDFVKKGTTLAIFKPENNVTQINYDNARRTLETTKGSAENAVFLAEISLQNAQQALKQTKTTEEQSQNQIFQNLQSATKNAEINSSNALNFVDRILGASKKFRYEQYKGRAEIGAKNFVKKNSTKNLVEKLARDNEILREIDWEDDSEQKVLDQAQERVDFAKELQRALFWFDDLVRDTILSSRFKETDRAVIQTQSEIYLGKTEGIISLLETLVLSAKTTRQRSNSTLLTVQNQVKSAQSNLELARANLESQVGLAENQYLLAQASQKELVIRALFDGIVSEKLVGDGDRILPNQKLFVLTNNAAQKKIVAFLSQEELEIFQSLETLFVQIEEGVVVQTKEKFLSSRVNPLTQKIRVEMLLEKNEALKKIFVGSFVQVLLPIGQTQKNLIPLSSISFEPDGAEVLVLNVENKTERRKITYGKIISDAVEVLDGLKKKEQVIRFYNRISVGETVEVVEEIVETF